MSRHPEPYGPTRADLHQRITDALVQQLEAGTRPWMKPWTAEHRAGRVARPLRHNGEPHHGINILLLWITAFERGYASPFWMTFKQALALGASVRKGEKGAPVIYADTLTRHEQAEADQDQAREIWFLKSYTVFNAEQIDGLPALSMHPWSRASRRRSASPRSMRSSRRSAR